MSTKKSIRFFNDQKVRAVWSDADNKWYFSATDVVRAINNEEDYTKCRNYWKYLKGKFAKEGIQLVSATNHFKFEAPDGKMRQADVLDNEAVQLLAKHYPNNSAIRELLRGAMTNWIDDREIFMKGIDYSYYYEQEE